MWLANFDCTSGRIAVFKHEKVAEKRLWTTRKGFFSVCSPEIECRSHCLFCSVVEVVTERRTDLRLGLDGSDKMAVLDNQ